MTQKFHKGDLVLLDKYFDRANVDALVIGSYKDQYGGSNEKSYTLFIKDGGQSSWWEESQLTLLSANRHDLLEQWEKEREADVKQKSDLDWIFDNGPDVAKHGYGASLAALGKCLGIDNMWGSHGEGYTWAINAMRILETARPFLVAKDKAGWARITLAVSGFSKP